MTDLKVTSSTQRIIVHSRSSVSVVNAGPVGPSGMGGTEDLMLHLMDPTPHAAYDDMQSLSSWLANQLA